MHARTIALSAIAVAVVVGGFVMSRSASPPPYVIPSDLAWFSPSFRCPTGTSANFANYVAWDAPQKRVVVGIQEKDPATGNWSSEQYVYSTSYNVLDVAYRLGGQELYIAGIQLERGGGYTDIVEKWVFPTPAGGYTFTVAGGVTSVGTARTTFSGSATITGGTYAAPLKRTSTPQPVPNQTIIYSQPSGGHINCLAADPEGRFLLLHNYTSGDVSSLDLVSANSVPQLVYSATQVPALTGVRSIALHDVRLIGRICRLSPENRSGAYSTVSTQVAVFVDPENDGTFNSFTVHSTVGLALGQTPYGESKDWSSVTNFGWDWKTEY